ncbi:hypothetical protein CPJCM30710_19900 [Clostridium polyendosporum]|uniref:Uncharacterized protein n=1 Tax=Clostridium polyendosporum TaxID=69208 RepID=A0A919VEM6_9CLOT|nr:hypothetical protein CPJCM30710_19900 [Clostridium polyendosporum]
MIMDVVSFDYSPFIIYHSNLAFINLYYNIPQITFLQQLIDNPPQLPDIIYINVIKC